MAKRQSFMMEAKTFDIKKSKTELPNLPSEQNQVLVIFFNFIFGKDFVSNINTAVTHKNP